MFQFQTYNADTESMISQAVKAIDGGAQWIELRADGVTPADRHEAIRLAAERLIPLCRGKNIFLIVNGQPDIVRELEVQGLHLEPTDIDPREARQTLGGGPVIGVTVTSPRQAVELARRDIDYIRVIADSPADIATYAQALQAAGFNLPIVAAGPTLEALTLPADQQIQQIQAYLNAGAKGITLSAPIATNPDPLQATATLLQSLQP